LAIRRALFGREHRLVEDTLSQLAELSTAKQGPRSTLEEVLDSRLKALGYESAEVATSLFELGRAAQTDRSELLLLPDLAHLVRLPDEIGPAR